MDAPIKVEVLLNAPVERVWSAISDKAEIKQWYFDLEEFIPAIGFTFSFYGGNDHTKYLHLCTVIEAVPNEKLAYTWRYDGYEGKSVVNWILTEEDGKTRLMLLHEGLESFPADKPDFAKHNFEEGWKYLIGSSLPKYLEGKGSETV